MADTSIFVDQMCEYAPCSRVFKRSVYDAKRGFRRFCSTRCGHDNRSRMHLCQIDLCEQPARRYSTGKYSRYCGREHSQLAVKIALTRTTDLIYDVGAYQAIVGPTARNHPAAGKNGAIYVHTLTAYEKYGKGPHQCNWCACQIEWMFGDIAGRLAEVRKIVIDHLDWDGKNNSPDNLVLSCSPCNLRRTNAL